MLFFIILARRSLGPEAGPPSYPSQSKQPCLARCLSKQVTSKWDKKSVHTTHKGFLQYFPDSQFPRTCKNRPVQYQLGLSHIYTKSNFQMSL